MRPHDHDVSTTIGALRLATERLRLATEAGLIGVWDWDIARDELVWDASMYRLYGLREADFGGAYEAWIRAVHPEDKAFADAEIRAALRGEREYAPEFRVVWPDGSIHHIKAASRTLRDAAGAPVRMVGINYDLTERKRAEEERLAHLRLLQGMDRVNRAIARAKDLEQMTGNVLDVLLSILGCDRAYLLYPCDAEAPTWRVPMERSAPEYPGALELGLEVPMDREVAEKMRLLLASEGPVRFGPGAPHPLPQALSERFHLKSFLAMALHPKVGKAWEFGVHQCSHARSWTPEEERLFQETGQRLADALTTFLIHADLRESEAKLANAERIVHVGYWDRDLVAGRISLSDEAHRISGSIRASRSSSCGSGTSNGSGSSTRKTGPRSRRRWPGPWRAAHPTTSSTAWSGPTARCGTSTAGPTSRGTSPGGCAVSSAPCRTSRRARRRSRRSAI